MDKLRPAIQWIQSQANGSGEFGAAMNDYDAQPARNYVATDASIAMSAEL